jgi:O-antigen/teichoic acid export membrane protein
MTEVKTRPNVPADSNALGGPGILLREAGWTFWLNVLARVAHFVTAVVLARWLGVAGFGAYSYAMGFVGLLSVIGGVGFGQLLVREIAAYQAGASWGRLAGIIRWTDRTAFFITGSLVLLGALVSWSIRARVDPLMLSAFWASLPLVPLLVFTRLRQAAVRGLMRLVAGQTAESAVLPFVFLALIVIVAAVGGPAQPWMAMLLQIVAAAAAYLFAIHALRRSFPQEAREVELVFDATKWLAASLGLFFITAVRVINARVDILLLGAISGSEAVGLYNAAARGAELVSLPLLIASVILAPRFASLYYTRRSKDLGRLFWQACGTLMVSSAPLLAALIVFREVALGFFGTGFLTAGTTLAILSLGQWVNASIGLSSLLLVMTGRERAAGGLVAGATVLNVTLNLLLIPRWGIDGAALATSLSLSLLNVSLLSVAVWRPREFG